MQIIHTTNRSNKYLEAFFFSNMQENCVLSKSKCTGKTQKEPLKIIYTYTRKYVGKQPYKCRHMCLSKLRILATWVDAVQAVPCVLGGWLRQGRGFSQGGVPPYFLSWHWNFPFGECNHYRAILNSRKEVAIQNEVTNAWKDNFVQAIARTD